MKQLEIKVGEMDYSSNSDADELFNEIKEKRDRLDELIIEWESLTEKIEGLSSIVN